MKTLEPHIKQWKTTSTVERKGGKTEQIGGRQTDFSIAYRICSHQAIGGSTPLPKTDLVFIHDLV